MVTPVTTLIFTLLIGTAGIGGHPIALSHSQATCEGTLDYGADNNDGSKSMEGWIQSDSRGAIMIEGEPGEYHCRAWHKGYVVWSGKFNLDEKRRTFQILLTKEKTK